MFFRQWRARRREAIAQQWMIEQTRLPPLSVSGLAIDPVALEGSQRAHAVADPLAALPVEADGIASRWRLCGIGRRDSCLGWTTHYAVIMTAWIFSKVIVYAWCDRCSRWKPCWTV
jgi:hypothetical protein